MPRGGPAQLGTRQTGSTDGHDHPTTWRRCHLCRLNGRQCPDARGPQSWVCAQGWSRRRRCCTTQTGEIPTLQRDSVCDRRSRPPWRRSHRLDQTTGADRSSQALQSHQASASVPRSCPPTACCRCRPRSHARHTSQSRVILFSLCLGPLKLVLHFSCRQEYRGLFKVRYQ